MRSDAISRLNKIRIEVLETTLGSAVQRQAHCDRDGLGWNKNRQRELENFVRGLSVIYLFSFLQSNLGDSYWTNIKNVQGSSIRQNEAPVDWDMFDAYKYVRDCFGHDADGELFPENQGNTKHFRTVLAEGGDIKVAVNDSRRIILGDGAVVECFQLVTCILQAAEG